MQGYYMHGNIWKRIVTQLTGTWESSNGSLSRVSL